VRYLPSQIPDKHANAIGSLLNEALQKLPQSMHLSVGSMHPNSPTPQPVSMYRQGLTMTSNTVQSDEAQNGSDEQSSGAAATAEVSNSHSGPSVCTVLSVSDLPLRRGLRSIVEDLVSTASRLQLPPHIVDDLSEAVKAGIRAAEEKMSMSLAEAYRPTNVLRWVPLVGSVINWMAPPAVPEYGASFHLKNKELSTAKVTYMGAHGSGGSVSGSSTPLVGRRPDQSGWATPSALPSSSSPLSITNMQTQPNAATGTTPTSTSTSTPTNGNRSESTPSQHTRNITPDGSQTATTAANKPQAAGSASIPPSRILPPVKITLDEADSGFVSVLNTAPKTLQADQRHLLQQGALFKAYFHSEQEEQEQGASASASPHTASVTTLFLFFEPSFYPSAEEAAELGVSANTPVSLLAWCEPDARYIKPDQAVAVEQVSALHLGAPADYFPRQTRREHAFSIITPHVALHLEANDQKTRQDWFLALFALVSQATPQMGAHAYTQMQQQQQGAGAVPSHAMSPPGVTPHSSPDVQLAAARAVLEGGMNFCVYVLDKHDPDVTTKHEVVLWYRPAVRATASTPAQPHSLCWCRRGGALDYSPARSLPLNKTVQICMGKQTRAFRCRAAAAANPAACFSVMVEKMILNLEASSAEDRANWLSCFHAIMSASGKKRVVDHPNESPEAQAQA